MQATHARPGEIPADFHQVALMDAIDFEYKNESLLWNNWPSKTDAFNRKVQVKFNEIIESGKVLADRVRDELSNGTSRINQLQTTTSQLQENLLASGVKSDDQFFAINRELKALKDQLKNINDLQNVSQIRKETIENTLNQYTYQLREHKKEVTTLEMELREEFRTILSKTEDGQLIVRTNYQTDDTQDIAHLESRILFLADFIRTQWEVTLPLQRRIELLEAETAELKKDMTEQQSWQNVLRNRQRIVLKQEAKAESPISRTEQIETVQNTRNNFANKTKF